MKRIGKIAAAVATVGALALGAATPSQARHGRHAAARTARPHHGTAHTRYRTARPYYGNAYDYAPRSGSFSGGAQGGCFKSPASLSYTMCQ
jgi:hypothetical protein